MRCLIFLLIVCCSKIYAQDTLTFSENHRFQDGIYLTYNDFKYDRPSYPLLGVKIIKLDSNKFHFTELYQINIKNKKGKYKKLALKDVWGLCYKGTPYINFRGKATDMGSNTGEKFFMNDLFGKETITFFKIVAIGRYCLFIIEGDKLGYNVNSMTNKAYQPKYQFVARKILDMETGEIKPLDFNSTIKAIESDTFVKSLFDENPILEALDKSIYLYNKRNPYIVDRKNLNVKTKKKK
jgi:hypothetical protein